ncbi:MAG: 16S rRNA (guanine(527)-N(7))-methyltransferase RsmG [Myxococcota bacterium]
MRNGDTRDTDEVAVFSLLRDGLSQLELSVPEYQVEQLAGLVAILASWAGRINLTGHRTPLEMASGLVLDAAALVECLPEIKAADSLADLGTGAGFPGLPIAILNPHLQVTLVDSRKKRNHFQREVRRQLSLDHVTPILGRAEAVAIQPSEIVVAQAMTQPDQALQLMHPWARPGGLVVLPASEAAVRPDPPEGIGTPELREYEVPTSGRARKLWVARVQLGPRENH